MQSASVGTRNVGETWSTYSICRRFPCIHARSSIGPPGLYCHPYTRVELVLCYQHAATDGLLFGLQLQAS